MTRALRLLVLALSAAIGALALLAPRPAFAQGLEVTGNVDAEEIELGDTITYTLQATSTTGESPEGPRLETPAGMTVVESGASPTHMVSIINGQRSERHGLTARWRLRSDRLGKFKIGPATVTAGSTRRSGPSFVVSVVAPGQAKPRARPRGPFPFDPFAGGLSPLDPFKGIFPDFGDDVAPDPFAGINVDPRYALDQPRGEGAFLHATIDKTRGVIGEQITLTVYLYEDLRGRETRPTDVHEATATDFLKRSLLQDETRAVLVGNAMVGGRPWSVKLVRKNALFPLKTGRLSIAPMSLTLAGHRGGSGLRESEPLFVDVTEPPVAGRPAGYQLGDTGDFSLSATTSPQEIDQHGAVGVTVELRGTGNMPAKLAIPEIAGVEWLDPQVKDSLGPVTADKFGGTRTFTYVVRLHRDGAIDLGELRLPYFDPQSRSYATARTSLGIVQVRKVAGRDAPAEVAEPLLPNLPAARTSLEGRRAESFLTERPIYWAALFGAPLACAVGLALTGAARRVRERRRSAAPSADRVARERRTEAEAALKGADAASAVAAVARALEAEVLATTGVNVRGTSGEAAATELEGAGVPRAAARSIVRVLGDCEAARFSPDGVSMDAARALWKDARDAIDAAAVRDEREAG